MIQSYRLIWGLLTRSERKRFILMMVVTFLVASFEITGVAGILPFLQVLSKPEVIHSNKGLSWAYETFGFTSDLDFAVALGVTILALIILGVFVRAGGAYIQARFSQARAYSISMRLLQGYLSRPYVWYLSRNSAELSQSILSEVDTVIRQSLRPGIQLISNSMIIGMIITLLILVEPRVAVGASILLGGVYVLTYILLRGPMGRVGERRLKANRLRFHMIAEISGGLKEIKVMGLEAASLRRFRKAASELVHNQTMGQLMTKLPRFVLEGVIYGSFILVILFLVLNGRNIDDMIPFFGLLGVAGTKLFPALQQFYSDVSGMRMSQPALQRLHDNLKDAEREPPLVKDTNPPLKLRRRLELRDLCFQYPSAERGTLDHFNAVIDANTTVGIVGGTGAGKTTVVDIILGILTPDSGDLLVDGQKITPERVRAWQKSIGYVPQHIFLTDDTISANIAFGVEPKDIDQAAAERAARIANLHDFVMTELPHGYATKVGERGVRLSGGQRQRIGIARALYHDPDVLILDEATSALDNITERAVMEAVHNLSHEKTVIMIAHRLSTVRACDKIMLLERGKLAAEGTYDELLEESASFRKMSVG